MNERCYAYRVMGKCYEEIGNWEKAEKAFHAAAAEAPNNREPWCELAMLTYRQRRWEETFAFSMRALKIKDKQLVYTCDPAVWGHWAHDLASISAWHLGMKDIAIEQAKISVEMEPNDLRLAKNLEYIQNAIQAQGEKAA
jgi:tetratricopeptide (TPR) repeat protein